MTPVRLRREDAAYAAATLFAAGLVAYLTVANFGLVPSPFAAADFQGPRPIGVPALLALPGPGDAGGAGGTGTVQVPTVPDLSGGLNNGTPPAPARDTVPPAVAIGTPDGAILVSLSGESVQGTASDDASGVDRVVVTFTPLLGEPSVILADMACTAGLTCSWSVAPPTLIGNYTIEAQAFDRSGNSATAGPVNITIVEAQPSSQASSGGLVGGAVDAVVGTVAGAVGTVANTAGGLLGALL